MSANDDKRMKPIDSIEIYTYGTKTDLLCKKEEIKCYNVTIKQCKKD